MKVLLVSGVYPPSIGGPSAQTQHIAHGLVARGIQTHVVTYGEKEEEAWDGPVPVTYISPDGGRGLIGKLGRNLSLWRRLAQVMDEFQPSVLQVQTINGPLPIVAMLLARRRGIPRLLKYVGDMSWVLTKANPDFNLGPRSIVRKLRILNKDLSQRWLLKNFQKIWATTPFFRDRLKSVYGVPEQKILLLPNFIELHSFQEIGQLRGAAKAGTESSMRPGEDISGEDIPDGNVEETILLSVCRVRPVKGVDVSIKALSLLRDLPVKLRIVGDCSVAYAAFLRQLCEECDVTERVEFVGAVPPDKIAAQYCGADIFVLLSHEEAFGIVLIEAMATGTAIVATRVGGIPNVVEDGVTALLVPPADEKAAADALRRLVEDGSLRESLSVAGQKSSRQFDLEIGLNALTATYRELISR